jgi:hypothetical protein
LERVVDDEEKGVIDADMSHTQYLHLLSKLRPTLLALEPCVLRVAVKAQEGMHDDHDDVTSSLRGSLRLASTLDKAGLLRRSKGPDGDIKTWQKRIVGVEAHALEASRETCPELYLLLQVEV